jgi:hypothetical protein
MPRSRHADRNHSAADGGASVASTTIFALPCRRASSAAARPEARACARWAKPSTAIQRGGDVRGPITRGAPGRLVHASAS